MGAAPENSDPSAPIAGFCPKLRQREAVTGASYNLAEATDASGKRIYRPGVGTRILRAVADLAQRT
jgi:hypothetical protein